MPIHLRIYFGIVFENFFIFKRVHVILNIIFMKRGITRPFIII